MSGNPSDKKLALERWCRGSQPGCRLICFTHAGAGAAAYQPWPALLPDNVEVCAIRLPGRERLISEQPFHSMVPLVDWVRNLIQPLLSCPFVVFGHSFGALVAFEIARSLRRHALPEPSHLLVSGHRAPHLPRTEPKVAAWPDTEFSAYVERMDGMSAAVLAHPELRTLVLPTLRADFAVIESYEYSPEPPLGIPVRAFGGAHDPLVPVRDLAPWNTHTRGPFMSRVFPGGHFYLHEQRDALLREIADTLPPLQGSRP